MTPLTYWHCLHSMRRRICVTVRCPSVCLSVCPIAPAKGQLWHSSVAGNRAAARRSAANAGSAVFAAKGRGWTQTCHYSNTLLSVKHIVQNLPQRYTTQGCTYRQMSAVALCVGLEDYCSLLSALSLDYQSRTAVSLINYSANLAHKVL